MAELFAAFKAYLWWSLALWLGFFVVFASVFARGRLAAFAGGLWRVLVSIVTSPFVFLRKAVEAVLRFDAGEERSARESDQYLLNKGLLVLQAVLIVVAIGALAAGVVVVWNTLVPPSAVRRDARDYAKEVEAQRAKSATAAKALETLNGEWGKKEAAVVGKFRKDRQTEIDRATRELKSVETSLATYGGPNAGATLTNLQSSRANIEDVSDIEDIRRNMQYTINSNWYWLGDWDRQTLKRWTEVWRDKAIAEYELANVSVDVLRAVEQPTFPGAHAMHEQEAQKLAQMEETLREKNEAASLKWKAASFAALGALITFLTFLWLYGAAIEFAWLAIRVAGDVRQIRERTTPREAERSQPQLPIRDAASPPMIAASPSMPA